MQKTNYEWVDDPTVSGIALCDTDVLNDCLMHLKYFAGDKTPLFAMMMFDYQLTGDELVGWAMQGSAVYFSAYPDAYNKIVDLYNNGTSTTYRGVACRKSLDGRYIADVSAKSTVDSVFSSTGVSDFYVLDKVNKFFTLPKTLWFYQGATSTSNVNAYLEPGLPNHTHSVSVDIGGSSADLGDPGVNYMTNTQQYNGTRQLSGTAAAVSGSSIYGKSTTVQPPASRKFLYYKVGNVIVNTTPALIEARGVISDALNQINAKTQQALDKIAENANAVIDIGVPLPTLSSTLPANHIWLTGSTVSRTTYSQLYAVYGTAYGAGDGSTTFSLPNFTGRVPWGVSFGTGYISAGIPNITGYTTDNSLRCEWLKGDIDYFRGGFGGAFYPYKTSDGGGTDGTSHIKWSLGLNASRCSSLYGASSTVQPPAIMVRWMTRYQ